LIEASRKRKKDEKNLYVVGSARSWGAQAESGGARLGRARNEAKANKTERPCSLYKVRWPSGKEGPNPPVNSRSVAIVEAGGRIGS